MSSAQDNNITILFHVQDKNTKNLLVCECIRRTPEAGIIDEYMRVYGGICRPITMQRC